jgi:hypothetical protein
MSQDIYKRRNQLIRDALEAAHQRVTAAGNDPSMVFAAVGELLFWIVAADDGLRKRHPRSYEPWRRNQQHGHLFDGIRYVRNKVAHASGAWDYETKDVYADRYAAYAARYDPWVWARLPPARHDPEQEGSAGLEAAVRGVQQVPARQAGRYHHAERRRSPTGLVEAAGYLKVLGVG